MEPRLWSKVIDTDGREEKLDPERMSRVMSEDTAETVTGMMTDVVNEGTATAAALGEIQVAGKTGTAEIDVDAGVNQAWFIGFAPAEDPEVAIAATIERTDGQGGTVAAPIAQQVHGGPAGEQREQRRVGEELMARARKGTVVDERYALKDKVGTGRDGRRLARARQRARPRRRDQDPPRPLRPGQRVRRAVQARGAVRGRACSTRTSSRSSTAAPFEDTYFIAMEYVDGPQLKELVKGGMELQGRDRLHPPDPERGALRAPQGDRPPRPEAAERDDRRGRPRPRRRTSASPAPAPPTSPGPAR